MCAHMLALTQANKQTKKQTNEVKTNECKCKCNMKIKHCNVRHFFHFFLFSVGAALFSYCSSILHFLLRLSLVRLFPTCTMCLSWEFSTHFNTRRRLRSVYWNYFIHLRQFNAATARTFHSERSDTSKTTAHSHGVEVISTDSTASLRVNDLM